MFEEHYKDGSFAGETSRTRRLIGVRFGILLVIGAISLVVVGYMKWSQSSLHEKLIQRHEKATAYYDSNPFRNSDGTYAVRYSFMVNGKLYQNYIYSKTLPTSSEGVVLYNPDNPDENELQPF